MTQKNRRQSEDHQCLRLFVTGGNLRGGHDKGHPEEDKLRRTPAINPARPSQVDDQ